MGNHFGSMGFRGGRGVLGALRTAQEGVEHFLPAAWGAPGAEKGGSKMVLRGDGWLQDVEGDRITSKKGGSAPKKGLQCALGPSEGSSRS